MPTLQRLLTSYASPIPRRLASQPASRLLLTPSSYLYFTGTYRAMAAVNQATFSLNSDQNWARQCYSAVVGIAVRDNL